MQEKKFRYLIETNLGNGKIHREWYFYTLNGLENGETIFSLPHYKIIARDQFTGECDVKGKEIYENDFLEIVDKKTYPYVRGLRRFRGWVSFEEGGFFMKEKKGKNNLWGIVGELRVKIIGNCHENKNLLKG